MDTENQEFYNPLNETDPVEQQRKAEKAYEKFIKQQQKKQEKEQKELAKQKKQQKKNLDRIFGKKKTSVLGLIVNGITFIPRFLFDRIRDFFRPTVSIDQDEFRQAVAEEMKRQSAFSPKDKEKTVDAKETVKEGQLSIIQEFNDKYGASANRENMPKFLEECLAAKRQLSMEEFCKAISYATDTMIAYNRQEDIFVGIKNYQKGNQEKVINFTIDGDYSLVEKRYKNNKYVAEAVAVLSQYKDLISTEEIIERNKRRVENQIKREVENGYDIYSLSQEKGYKGDASVVAPVVDYGPDPIGDEILNGTPATEDTEQSDNIDVVEIKHPQEELIKDAVEHQYGDSDDSPHHETDYKWSDPYKQAQEYANEQMEEYGKEQSLYESEKLSVIYHTDHLDEIRIKNNTDREILFAYPSNSSYETINIPANGTYSISDNEPEFNDIHSAVCNQEFSYNENELSYDEEER